ncbi:pinensin family lanthipeptide [Roseivirga sp. BDSF3-8]|uniref:pinensin family lanthipeptide n=1 Tax=Roseivirga sp. BDSF3-8 TaxID=3241598 RepID=UPI003531E5EE
MKKLNLDDLKVQSFITEVNGTKGGVMAAAGESEFNTVCPFCNTDKELCIREFDHVQ